MGIKLRQLKPGATVIATDGSCRDMKPRQVSSSAWLSDVGGWGLAARQNTVRDGITVLYSEIRAISIACEANSGPLRVLSDSREAIEMLQGWQRGKTVALPTDWAPPMKAVICKLATALRTREHPVRAEWVKGHAGHPLNEGADALASLASRAQRDELGTAEVRRRADGIAEAFAEAYAALRSTRAETLKET